MKESLDQKRRNVLILAGTGDSRAKSTIELATKHWKNHGIDVTVYNVGWREDSLELAEKLRQIERLVDDLSQKGEVSIIGCSAGASAAFNILLKKPDVVQKAIGICGRIRGAKTEWGTNGHDDPFVQSVLLFEGNEAQIPDELRKRMMTVTARYGDGLVPDGAAHVEGAQNITIPTKMHGLSIVMALTLFKKPLIDFIKLSPAERDVRGSAE